MILLTLSLIVLLLHRQSNAYEDLGEGIFIERNSLENNESRPRIALLTVIIENSKADQLDKCVEDSYENIVSFGTKTKEQYAKNMATI